MTDLVYFIIGGLFGIAAAMLILVGVALFFDLK